MFVLPPRARYSPRLRVVSTKLIIKLIKAKFLLSSSLPRSRPFFPAHRIVSTPPRNEFELRYEEFLLVVESERSQALAHSLSNDVDDETRRLLREEAKKGSGELIFQLITRRVQF